MSRTPMIPKIVCNLSGKTGIILYRHPTISVEPDSLEGRRMNTQHFEAYIADNNNGMYSVEEREDGCYDLTYEGGYYIGVLHNIRPVYSNITSYLMDLTDTYERKDLTVFDLYCLVSKYIREENKI